VLPLSQPRRPFALRTTALTMAAVLVTFAVAVLIQRTQGQSAALAVLAVTLTLTVDRAARRRPLGALHLVAVPVLGMLAALLGRLMVGAPALGDPLFVAGVAGSVWARQLPGWAGRLATLAALPLITMLITPVPPTRSPATLLWSALIAAVAVAVVLAAQRLRPAPAPAAPPAPRATTRRLSPSARLALQMAVALGAAALVGRLFFGQHWPWLVLSAYLVNAGAVGRGDVAHKAVLRVAGAAGGTVLASLAAAVTPGHHPASIVAIFVVLAVAGALREHSYAWWAAGVTTALSLLYGYFGAADPALLAYRLVAIVLGAGLGVAAAWLVVPLRTRDVLRRRVADVLAALTDFLVAARRDPGQLPEQQRILQGRLADLERLAPALRAHQRLVGGRRPHHADAVAALAATGPTTEALARQLTGDPPADERLAAGITRLREDVVALRRALAGRKDAPGASSVPPHQHPDGGEARDAEPVHRDLVDLHRAVARVGAVIAPRPPAP
jgi:uncharacterized membrane protein YccC